MAFLAGKRTTNCLQSHPKRPVAFGKSRPKRQKLLSKQHIRSPIGSPTYGSASVPGIHRDEMHREKTKAHLPTTKTVAKRNRPANICCKASVFLHQFVYAGPFLFLNNRVLATLTKTALTNQIKNYREPKIFLLLSQQNL